MKNANKYKPFGKIPLENRKWPEKEITHPPIWCSVDLRDGNQALAIPMGVEQKLAFFDLLVKTGFKEIEVGFPSASQTEYDFLRRLIEENRIPDDVTIQVLCQAREHLVKKTFECLKGAKSAIFHIYNSTSPAQRKYTFNMSKEEIVKVAIDGVRCVKDCLPMAEGTKIRLEYSPESFSNTEIDFAVEICEAVKKEWGASPENKIILNLPTTVECATPNIHADQIEYFATHISDRDSVIISLHNHNDRGEGVASCELALLAGADRVEGTLFGNGERTGNLDIVTVALNMYTQGVDPQLDFSNIGSVAEAYMKLTGMPIHPRHPYAGELVFTAFSGSHQDAIRKGMAARAKMPADAIWDVPYLPLDPHDVGREYEEIIRINSQSGKGGAAWILEQDYGIFLPKAMHPAVGAVITAAADTLQREVTPAEIYEIFSKQWLKKKSPLAIVDLAETHLESGSDQAQVMCRTSVEWQSKVYSVGAKGNGPLDAFVAALSETPVPKFSISAFHEHSVGSGSDTDAMAYIEITLQNGKKYWGCGKSSNIGRAGIKAVVSAVNQI
ncbi:MAG: 2-isopropylmalate synthase [Spirochaetaceae bacterium]|nr:2-isopropylmalate synthase [Spirochaetaceae bacterium]